MEQEQSTYMKIFVTGGTGFVGSHLTRKLAEEHEVTVGGLEPESSVLELPEEVERERIDVTDRVTLDFSGYDCVIHLVALSPLKQPPVPYEVVHVEGTENVVKQAEEDGVDTYFQMSALGANDDSSMEYLRTKGEAEKIVEESELDWRIFRPSTLFGEGGEFLNFISRMTTPRITVLPGKNTAFQPLHVHDLVDMIVESLKEEHSGQKFELGGPKRLSLGAIARKIDESRGRNLRVLGLPMPLFLAAMMVAEQLPLIPFGVDQYRSLKTDNVPNENEIEELGFEASDLENLDEYLRER